jgi:hypothetical protein
MRLVIGFLIKKSPNHFKLHIGALIIILSLLKFFMIFGITKLFLKILKGLVYVPLNATKF